jgi:hypothetical protein
MRSSGGTPSSPEAPTSYIAAEMANFSTLSAWIGVNRISGVVALMR